jgi:hypothetical protein
MLMVTLPKGQLSGTCRINGETCDYAIEDACFIYQVVGAVECARKYIVSAKGDDSLTQYICDEADVDEDLIAEMREFAGLLGCESSLDPILLARFARICMKAEEVGQSGFLTV